MLSESRSTVLSHLHFILLVTQMQFEPFPSEARDFVERSRFFKEMGCTGDDLKPLFTSKLCGGLAVQFHNGMILFTDDEKSGCLHAAEDGSG
jgi:hypothetical protein